MLKDTHLYTKEEVALILRLDRKGVKNPTESVRYLVRTGQLKALIVAGQQLFTEQALSEYSSSCENDRRN